jgi:hypothetical protein
MSLKGEILTLLQNAEVQARRVGTNADYTPGGNFNIFSITGGPVRVTGMFGHVRVACTGNALVPLLSYYPLVTGIGSITAIATIAVGAIWPVDTILVWDGTLADVLAPSVGLGHGQAGPASTECFVAGYIDMLPGFITVVNATADATAEIDWYVSYKKLVPASQLLPV